MTSLRGVALLVLLCVASLAGPTARAQAPSGGEGGEPLTMEELEVRGILEKPGRLFVPAPAQIHLPLPVRFDFFREDMAVPILPREITNERLPNGGDGESGNASD